MISMADYLMENTRDVERAVNDTVSYNMEEVLSYKIKDAKDESDLEELSSEIQVDETDIINLNFEQMLDLCIVAEEEYGAKIGVKEFSELDEEVAKVALSGFDFLVQQGVQEQIQPLLDFIDEYDLDVSTMEVGTSIMDRYRPDSIKSIKGGELTKFIAPDNGPDIHLYTYSSDFGTFHFRVTEEGE